MPLTYRQMRAEDVPAALAVRLSTKENAVTLDELKEDYSVTPQSVADELRSDASGWVCEDDGTLVGFSMGNGLNGEIAVVAVAPEYEGRGIGKTVLAHTQNGSSPWAMKRFGCLPVLIRISARRAFMKSSDGGPPAS